MLERMRTAAKLTLSPILYRYPPFSLQPQRLAFYITALLNRSWLAGDGYRKFCAEAGLPEEYYYGLGIARKPI